MWCAPSVEVSPWFVEVCVVIVSVGGVVLDAVGGVGNDLAAALYGSAIGGDAAAIAGLVAVGSRPLPSVLPGMTLQTWAVSLPPSLPSASEVSPLPSLEAAA